MKPPEKPGVYQTKFYGAPWGYSQWDGKKWSHQHAYKKPSGSYIFNARAVQNKSWKECEEEKLQINLRLLLT